MNEKSILLPMFFQIGVIILVWVWMYVTRIKEILVKKIDIQDLSTSSKTHELLQRVAPPSENLVNLFEIPILFFLAIILVYISDLSDIFYIGAAWCFACLRLLHSLVHITYNSVLHRFSLYFVSTLILWVIWFRLFIQMISTN